ncbi:hypothetical protein M0R04_06820 [Candidatus Dojkabacteria bacterium]|jgi:hypothetical protein|nr:hypothetical protein [Candidatus Dojkabacteria bacterium]
MPKTLTLEQFIEKANKVHNNKYDYSLVEYINNSTKVTIKCNTHGTFTQKPGNHLTGKNGGGNGCQICAQLSRVSTNLEKYGGNPAYSPAVKQKKVQTCLSRYGETSYSKTTEFNERVKNTNLSKFGVEYPLQNPNIQKKAKQTITERYGVDNRSQIHITNIILLIDSKDWLTSEYINQEKSAAQIANELSITVNTVYVYLRKHNIKLRHQDSYSYACITWLDSIIEKENISIQHALKGGEYSIPRTPYHADGYCVETNTIYEFHGDAWHGNPNKYKPTYKCHPKNKKVTAGDLYQATIIRENKIKELGYNLVVMWEGDYNKL